MGFLDTKAKAAAYENSAKQVAEQNAMTAAQANELMRREGLARQRAAEQQALLQAKEYGKYELMDELRAAQQAQQVQAQYGMPQDSPDQRFAQPMMADQLGLAQRRANTYQGQVR